MRNRKRWLTRLVKYGLQGLLYILMLLCFYGFQSISNPQLLNLSRTTVTTALAFILSTLVLSVVYGGFDIGVRKKRSVLSSTCLTFLLTDIVTYLFLQIMNVNPQNPEANARLVLWGEDLLLLLAVIVVQMALIYLLVDQLYTPLLHGVVTMSTLFERLCPVYNILSNRSIDANRVETGKTYIDSFGIEQQEYIGKFELTPDGWIYAGILAVLGLALLLLARRIYKKRNLERAGDFLAARWLDLEGV